MILKYIKIDKYRCFEKVEFTLNYDVNLFIGNNSAGKTTVVDFISNAFGSVYLYPPNTKSGDISSLATKEDAVFIV